MGLEQFDADQFDTDQIERVRGLLQAAGLDPNDETMTALAKTARSRYPTDPTGLEKAAHRLLEFFASRPPNSTKQAWERFRQWAASIF